MATERSSPRWGVLGIGALAVDDLIYVDGFPEPGAKVYLSGEQRHGGGLAGTALVAAARLGVTAAYAGVLGNDELSAYSIAELEADGVDCSAVRRASAARPYHSFIVVDRRTGERTILASSVGVTPPRPEDMNPELIGACRMLLVDSTVALPALQATEVAKHLGVPVIADLERLTDGVAELAARVDHLIVGSGFAALLAGPGHPSEIVRRLTHPGQAACVVTAGAAGCWYTTDGGADVIHQPACSVEAVDTTGCGDVFHGAYAAALLRGCDAPRAVAVATVAAGLKATQPGGRRGIPDWSTIETYLRENRIGRE